MEKYKVTTVGALLTAFAASLFLPIIGSLIIMVWFLLLSAKISTFG